MSFKKVSRKNLRTKSDEIEEKVEEQDEEEDKWQKIEELKLIQSLKKKTPGLDLDALSKKNEPKSKPSDEKVVKTSGLMSSLDLTNTFSAETNRRDEDKEMFKFIEQELAKKKGLTKTEDDDKSKQIPLNPDELIYQILPQHLLESGQKKSEEMLSNQMLSGIPEVDLGVEERIRNIEATEDAKMKWIEKKFVRNNRDEATLAPVNVAVNYRQNARTTAKETHESAINMEKIQKINNIVREPVVVIGDEPREGYFPANKGVKRNSLKFPGKEKATDDYHVEKFRKKFRK